MKIIKNRKAVSVAFGRLNPPTIAHEMLINTISQQDAEPRLYLSHSVDKKKNPLSYDLKREWCIKAFGDLVNIPKSEDKNMFEVLSSLYKEGYTDVFYVCGSDRVVDAERLKDYNGKETKSGKILFDFNSFEIVKAGDDRLTEDDIQLSRVSASMQREFAKQGDLASFIEGCPSQLTEEECEELFDDVRAGMGLNDQLNEAELLEGQDDIVGTVTIDSNKGKITADIFSVGSKNIFGIKLGPNRFFADWENAEVYSITVDSDFINDKFEGVSITSSDGRHVRFVVNKDGKQFKFDGRSGSSRDSSGFTDSETKNFEEVISGMILHGDINTDVKTVLENSVIKEGSSYILSGIFDIGLKCNMAVNEDFYNKWQSFISVWAKPLQVMLDQRDIFYSCLPKPWTKTLIENSIMLHPNYGNGYFINKSDVYDKSDVYFCSDISIATELNTLIKSSKTGGLSLGKEYCNLVDKLIYSGNLLGVSLKKPMGNTLHCSFDTSGYHSESFDDMYLEYHFTELPGADRIKTINLRFISNSNINYPILEVRSDGDEGARGKSKFAIQWKFNKASAWAGKGKLAFEYLFGQDEKHRLVDAAKEQNYFKCANIILQNLGLNIDDDYIPTQNEKFELNETFKKNLASFINLSIGYQGQSTTGERITAPYIKVY